MPSPQVSARKQAASFAKVIPNSSGDKPRFAHLESLASHCGLRAASHPAILTYRRTAPANKWAEKAAPPKH